jgi:hypothetical protein
MAYLLVCCRGFWGSIVGRSSCMVVSFLGVLSCVFCLLLLSCVGLFGIWGRGGLGYVIGDVFFEYFDRFLGSE